MMDREQFHLFILQMTILGKKGVKMGKIDMIFNWAKIEKNHSCFVDFAHRF